MNKVQYFITRMCHIYFVIMSQNKPWQVPNMTENIVFDVPVHLSLQMVLTVIVYTSLFFDSGLDLYSITAF